jgi:hypothetical protein
MAAFCKEKVKNHETQQPTYACSDWKEQVG